MELDSDNDEQMTPPLLGQNDSDGDDDNDEDSDEKNRCWGHRYWSMLAPVHHEDVRWSTTMDLDSDIDKTMMPPLFKQYDRDSDDVSDNDSDEDSDKDSDTSGHHGYSSSGDDDNVVHGIENLGYLHDSIANMRNKRWDYKHHNCDELVRKLEHEG